MDTPLLVSILALVVAGFLVFLSASLGILARDPANMGSMALKQIYLGLVPGLLLMYGLSRFDHLWLRKVSFWAFVAAVILNLIIFIPGVGFTHGGATRWLLIGSFSFQVSEVLKIAAVLCWAGWLSAVKDRVRELRYGFVPLLVMLGVVGVLCLLQPDTDTLAVISASLVAMYMVAGGLWRHLGLLVLTGMLGLALLAFARPYVMARIMTFVDPSRAPAGSSYQIDQSLIAIGSGQATGRGFGQSIQKFNFLPEPVGDSIFAVAAEEFGFVGAVTLILLYVLFAMRALKVANGAKYLFGKMLAVGIVVFIIAQSFVNISAMIGILPLSGIPLLFVSQGGTALLFVLAEAGMLLNISRSAKVI